MSEFLENNRSGLMLVGLTLSLFLAAVFAVFAYYHDYSLLGLKAVFSNLNIYGSFVCVGASVVFGSRIVKSSPTSEASVSVSSVGSVDAHGWLKIPNNAVLAIIPVGSKILLNGNAVKASEDCVVWFPKKEEPESNPAPSTEPKPSNVASPRKRKNRKTFSRSSKRPEQGAMFQPC